MSVTTIELYEALVSAGVEEQKARRAAEAVLTRTEARDVLVTKSDLYKALLVQTGAIAAIMTGILALLF